MKQTALGSVLKLERIPLEVDPDTEYVQIGIRSFGKGIFHRVPIKGEDLSKLRYFELRPNRLIVSNIMAWEGAIAVSGDAEKDCVGSSRFLSYAPAGEVDLSYINYFFQSEAGRALIRGTSTGTVLRNQTLSIKDFESMEIPLPNLSGQRKVVARLDSYFRFYETLSMRLSSKEVNSLNSLANGGVDQILARWAEGVVRVSDVCEIRSDLVRPGEDPGLAKEFVGLEHVEPHLGFRRGSRLLGDEKGRKFRFAPGDVLYGYLRPYLNKVWLADRNGLCSVEQYVLRANGKLRPELISAALRGRRVLGDVVSLTNNLQLPRLRSGLLMAMEIPFIPEMDQVAAANEIDTFMGRVRRLVDLQNQRNSMMNSLRVSLLNDAFRGQL